MAAKPLKSGCGVSPNKPAVRKRVNRILDVAEQMFIEEGYEVTTTNAIAARAEVPIGTLYQFFADKDAILYALVERYVALLKQKFEAHDAEGTAQLPEYVAQIVDAIDQFFTDYPGYHAIFMQAQGTVAELEAWDNAADAQFIQDWALELAQRDDSLTREDCEAIAFILVKTMGTILWASQSQKPEFRKRLVEETKRFTLSYLQRYFP